MSRKPIQVFNISFLDLICGALGAVILLFIVVPKLDSATRDELEALQQVNVEIEELENILEQARNSIPKEIYEEIQSQIESLQESVATLTEAVENLQQQLAEANARIENLESQVQQQQQQIESMNQQMQQQQQQINSLNEQISQLEEQIRDCEQNTERLEAEGRFAVITMSWETEGDDVDLHIIDPTGAEFFFQRTENPGRPGKLTKDDLVGPGVEVWQTNRLDPGTYQVKANLYSWKSGVYPELVFWVYYRNGNKSFRTTLYRESEKKSITSFRVASDGTLSFN